MATLAKLTNVVQQALRGGQYAGAIWLEGSPFVEETTYWLNLLIDTTAPIVGNSSQRPHGAVGNDGDRNIVDSVDYITSRIWADESGRDSIGAVAILDEQIFTARDVQKADARPGRLCRHRRPRRHHRTHRPSRPAAVHVQDHQAAYLQFSGKSHAVAQRSSRFKGSRFKDRNRGGADQRC